MQRRRPRVSALDPGDVPGLLQQNTLVNKKPTSRTTVRPLAPCDRQGSLAMSWPTQTR
jgi:hypothetical protein